ncbi:hypothetical protein EDC96DRAFT_581706 [Choanephora cucurbitarum]|nr:hypothetical protein EDC96DRAFT_581706 [Choanephora cucurbitarum]
MVLLAREISHHMMMILVLLPVLEFQRDYNSAFVSEVEDILTGRQRTEQPVNDVYENDFAGDDFLDFGLYMEEATDDNDTMTANAFLDEIDQPIQYMDEDDDEEEDNSFDDAVAEAVANIEIQDAESTITDATCINVNVPPQPFTFREKHSISQFAYAKLSGLSLSVGDDIIKSNNRYLNAVLTRNNVPRSHVKYDVLSTKATLNTIRQKVSNLSAFVIHQTCDNGCYLFDPVADRNTSACPVCGSVNKGHVKICSLAKKVAYLLSSEEKRAALRYRHDNFGTPKADDNTSYDDIFDGDIYQECLKKGLFELPNTIALALNVDGFSSKCSKKSFVTVHAVILNYSPVERSRGHYSSWGKIKFDICSW